jgi:hypothetical protein
MVQHPTHLRVMVDFSLAAPTEAEITLMRNTFRDCLTRAVYRDRRVHIVDTDRPRVKFSEPKQERVEIRFDYTKDPSSESGWNLKVTPPEAADLLKKETTSQHILVANTDVPLPTKPFNRTEAILLVLTQNRQFLFDTLADGLKRRDLRIAQHLQDPLQELDCSPKNWQEPMGDLYRAWLVMPSIGPGMLDDVKILGAAQAALLAMADQIEQVNADAGRRVYCAGPLRFTVIQPAEGSGGEPQIGLWLLLNVQGDTGGKNVDHEDPAGHDVPPEAGCEGRGADPVAGV